MLTPVRESSLCRRQAILSRIANSKFLVKFRQAAYFVVAILAFLFVCTFCPCAVIAVHVHSALTCRHPRHTRSLLAAALTESRHLHEQHASQKHHNGHHHGSDYQTDIRMFRADRNLYIAGFALFLLLYAFSICSVEVRLKLRLECLIFFFLIVLFSSLTCSVLNRFYSLITDLVRSETLAKQARGQGDVSFGLLG